MENEEREYVRRIQEENRRRERRARILSVVALGIAILSLIVNILL